MNEAMGKFIASLRKEKNMTQKDLADKLYVSDRAVSKWERGLNFPDITLLKKLSEVLGVSLTELFNGERMDDVSKEKSDEILEDGVKHYKKQVYKNIIIKVLLIIPIIIFFLFVILVTLSELYYGEIEFGKYHLPFPNVSSTVAKVTTDKFMKAFANEDLDTIKAIYRDKNADGTFMNKFLDFYQYYEVIDYDYSYFYHNGNNYTIVYLVTLEVNDIQIEVGLDIAALKNDVVIHSLGYEYGNDVNRDIELVVNDYNLWNAFRNLNV